MANYFNTSIMKAAILVLFLSTLPVAHTSAMAKFADSVKAKLVTVGNHQLYVEQQGPQDSRLTVVFESGAGGTSQDWMKVRTLLPPSIRTIAYDRAGSGKSEAGPLPRTMAQEVLELHELLKAIDVKGPIILVGQSLGGLSVRLYTTQYGKDVAGLVLVDPTHESCVLGSLKYGGWVRLREKAVGKPIPSTQLKLAISPGNDTTADYMAEEFQNIYLSMQKSPRQLGDRPLVVIGAGVRNQPPGTPDEQWKQLRTERDQQVKDLVILSSDAQFILATKSTHAIQNDNPEIVANAIKMVLEKIK